MAGTSTGLSSLARMGADSGGTLTERTNDSILALNVALRRLSCVYSLGFRDDDVRGGHRKSLTVSVGRKGLRAAHAAAYVLRTEEAKRESRLLAAFINPASADDGSLRVLLVPRGGDGKTWKASAQLRLRPTGQADSSAELGASIVRGPVVTDHFAASIATKNGTRAKVLEKSIDIAPGDFWVSAVARDSRGEDVAAKRLDANWPNPQKSPAAIAPIAALQAGPAAISKDGSLDSSGSLARDVDELFDPAIDISLRSVVCRGAKTAGAIVVERWVEDGSSDKFPEMTIDESADPCVQIVDVVSAGRLQPGDVDYRIVARIGDEVVAQERRTLRVRTTP